MAVGTDVMTHNNHTQSTIVTLWHMAITREERWSDDLWGGGSDIARGTCIACMWGSSGGDKDEQWET